MAASMSDVGSVGGDMSGGEESSMDDSSSTGGVGGPTINYNALSLQSPARNGTGMNILMHNLTFVLYFRFKSFVFSVL